MYDKVPIPEGYSIYNPFITNHAMYGHPIHINGEQYTLDTIQFDHNYVNHQHYVYAMHCRGDPPMAPYGWPLEAAPYEGPALNPTITNDTDLAPFHANHTDKPLVDIGLYNINDRGLTADINRLQGYEEEHVHLLECQQCLERDTLLWSRRIGPVRERLITAKARTRLHPFLTDNHVRIYNPNPAIPHPLDWPTNQAVELNIQHQYIDIGTALRLTEEGHLWLPRPWYHDEAGPGSTTTTMLMVSRCVYCSSHVHSITYCPNPHCSVIT